MTPSASAPRREALVPRACALLVGLLVFGCCRAAAEYGTRRPPPGERKFESRAVEDVIDEYAGRMRDRDLAELFANCLPNTLDTTVHIGKVGGLSPLTAAPEVPHRRQPVSTCSPRPRR
jgi:hypothetical protein